MRKRRKKRLKVSDCNKQNVSFNNLMIAISLGKLIFKSSQMQIFAFLIMKKNTTKMVGQDSPFMT